MNLYPNLSKYAAALIAVVVCYLNFTKIPENVLSWDVFGYYLYLPLTFIYHDLGLENMSAIDGIIEKYHNTSSFYQAMPSSGGGWVMKYSMGLAILYLPFFLIGHLFAIVTGWSADGFSEPYQLSITIGSFVYTIAGIYALRKVLRFFFTEIITSIVLLTIAFGTNYLFHVSFHGQNAMSHNFLFTFYAFILVLTIH